MIRQQLSLDLGTDAELTIHPLMPACLLQHLVVFNGDTGKICHQLNVTAMNIGPNQIP